MNRTLPRGFTLVELAVACTVAAVLAAVAVPSVRRHELQAGRLDAVQALTRLQAAQEAHRSAHGFYAHDVSALGVSTRSVQGRWRLALVRSGASTYEALAVADGPQRDDTACSPLTLSVSLGFASHGPRPRCWNR